MDLSYSIIKRVICIHQINEQLNNFLFQPLLVKEYNSIILRPIIWNTLANLELCILNRSFGTLLEALETQFLKATDEIKKKAFKQLRKDAAAYRKSKPEDKAKNLQDIEGCFIENLIKIPLPTEWEMEFVGSTCKQQAQLNATKLVSNGVANLKGWRAKPEIDKVNQLIQEKTTLSFRSRIATSKTRLQNVGTHPSLIIMLNNFTLFEPFLKVILEKYEVEGGNGERVEISDINEVGILNTR